MTKRDRPRVTFDGMAALYDDARPGYPEALFDDVVVLSGIPPGGRILEIGCGTGKATEPFVHRDYGILCVELGGNLAAFARRKLAAYPQVEVVTGAFEDRGLPLGRKRGYVPQGLFRAAARRGHRPVLEQARAERQERGLLRGGAEDLHARGAGIRGRRSTTQRAIYVSSAPTQTT